MKYLKLFIIVLIFLIKPAHSYDNFDECGILVKFLKEKQFELSLDEIKYTKENYFGIRVRYDDDFYEPNITKVHPNLVFKNQVKNEEDKLDISDLEGEFITEINGKKTTSLNEENFYKEFNKNSIVIKLENNPNSYEIEKKNYENFEIYFNGDVKNISSIDSKNSRFYSIFDTEVSWYDDRLSKISSQINKEGFNKHNDLKKATEKLSIEDFKTGFLCKINIDVFTEIGYWIPNIYPQNFTPDEALNKNQDYILFDFYLANDDCDYCTDLERKYGIVSLSVSNSYRGHIHNQMKLNKFPFDSQTLALNFKVENELGTISEVFHSSSDIIDTNLTNLKNDEWNIRDGWTGYGHHYLTEFDIRLPYLAIYFEIDRKPNYFFFKLMLPIVFLLFVSWSTFWINPKELESRVTVSIVCLLSLIAYNFVIDNDLPKLGYLTFMDKFILITYIFSGIPTLQTVLCRHFIDLDNYEIAKKIDRKSKIYIPLSFFAVLLILVINYEVLDTLF